MSRIGHRWPRLGAAIGFSMRAWASLCHGFQVLVHRILAIRARVASRLRSSETWRAMGPIANRVRTVIEPLGRRIVRIPSGLVSRLRRVDHTRAFRGVTLSLVILATLWLEVSTGLIQALTFSAFSSRLRYRVEPGPSPRILFPRDGPSDGERGYLAIPAFGRALAERGLKIREQARFSNGLLMLGWLGIPFIYSDKPVAGLVIRDARGDTLFDAAQRRSWFRSYDDIPPLVSSSLLFIENRRLQSDAIPTQNPAVDWGRLARATLLWGGRSIGLSLPVEGGSTLAVQLVKYRHSRDGRTSSGIDKLRQITAASLAAYREGPDTRPARRQVVLDYLNTMPLASAPGFGEVSGVNDGLVAWFGLDPKRVWRGLRDETSVERRAAAYKPVLALLCSARAPSRYLLEDHAGLERRVDAFTRIFERTGLIDSALARATLATPLEFPESSAALGGPVRAEDKPAYAVRRELSRDLGIPSFYSLDRLDLEVETTLDDRLQERVLAFFRELQDSSFVRRSGLNGERLLAGGDPSRVRYSLLLFESDPAGDRVCAHVDNLDAPFDLATGTKLELGSTAKLRTLTHYLQIVEILHGQLAPLDSSDLRQRAAVAHDPITRDVASILANEPGIGVDTLLARALARTYSANPGESFFTGGGLHVFHNFDRADDEGRFTVHDALVRSNNLVFVRLMRDIVRWHAARLPYDAWAALHDVDDPERGRLLRLAADDEARTILWRAYRRFRGKTAAEIEADLMESAPRSRARAAAMFYAWHPHAGEVELRKWLGERMPEVPAVGVGSASVVPEINWSEVGDSSAAIERLARTYGNPSFTLLDYGYALRRHPLEVWLAGQLVDSPGLSFDALWASSDEARELCRRWLLDPRQVRAQNIRLRTRIEKDAFERMTPAWQALGFPFERLVPSLATAIGASGDRPAALAELMGVIVADGVRRPARRTRELVLAGGTPYHTAFETEPEPGRRVLSRQVATALRGALADVVRDGTARRVNGAFLAADRRPLSVGGKTGSGDNGQRTRGGAWQSTSRTAVFTFYLGERHYGVITAAVWGRGSGQYRFTSALPLAVLQRLAPVIEDHLGHSPTGSDTRPGRPPLIATIDSPGEVTR